MALLFTLPRSNQFDAVGQLMSGWVVEFYATGTSTPKPVYADPLYANPLGTSVQAGDDGSLRPIYLDDSGVAYKILIKNANGEIVPNGTIDPYLLGPDQETLVRILNPQTPSEEAASIAPVDLTKVEGHIERYLTWAGTSTDFTPAFAAVSAIARSKPGLVIQFTPGRTYSTTALGGAALFNLQGARGISVLGNGALISAGNINSGILDVFDLNGASDIEISGLRYQQSNTALDSSNGGRFFRIREGSSRIKVSDCAQVGGYGGIVCIGSATTGLGRSEQITALNCRFENVYYPQSFQASGDQYFARGIKTLCCGRSYFPWNVRQHDVQMTSQAGGPFDDCLLKVYADPASAYNRLEQIKLVYHSTGRHSSGSSQSAGAAVIAIEIQQNTSTSTPAEVSGIDVTVNYDAIPTPTTNKLFTIRKSDSAGAPDTTGRSHVLSNIKIGGRVRGWQNANGPACVHLFSTTDGDVWTGDSAWNCSVEDFYATGDGSQAAIHINHQPFPADTGVSLRRVFTNMQITRANANEQHAFAAEQVVSANIVCGGYKSYTPAVTGSTGNPTLGDGTVTGRWRRLGDWVDGYAELLIGSTTSAGSGNIRFSLPTLVANGEGDQILGNVLLFDNGTRHYTGTPFIQSNTQYVEMYADQAVVTFAAPFSPAAGDKYRVSFRYLTAP